MLAASLALLSCIQGPWDYYPEKTVDFKGIWLTGYAIADRPLDQVCMEAFLDLKEESTDAFPFYDSARVVVTGPFRAGSAEPVERALELGPRKDLPNCFAADSAYRVVRGGAYALEARVAWDSAGTRVLSALTATARVPDSFSIRRTARAPVFAHTGGVPANLFDSAFFQSLPPRAQEELNSTYGDSLTAYKKNPAAYRDYLIRNAERIKEDLLRLMQGETQPYEEGKALYYLSKPFNLLAHLFTADYDSSVGGVLVVQRFDTTAGLATNAFSGLFGSKIDTADFYYEGNARRLLLTQAFEGPNGYRSLDSIGILNIWFFIGHNRFVFYGVEDAYVDFIQSAQEAEENPRVRQRSNVTGGRGVFAGAVPDTFDLPILADSLTKIFPMPLTRAYVCRGDWFEKRDCSVYYRTWCESTDWKEQDCRPDAVRASLEALLAPDSTLAAAVDSARSIRAAKDTAAVTLGERRFCAEHAFPDDAALGGICRTPEEDCGRPGVNGCKEVLWTFCKQEKWAHPQCKPALAWYCRDLGRPSEVMCRAADTWCRDNPDEAACR